MKLATAYAGFLTEGAQDMRCGGKDRRSRKNKELFLAAIQTWHMLKSIIAKMQSAS
jgi:hypothetical protein